MPQASIDPTDLANEATDRLASNPTQAEALARALRLNPVPSAGSALGTILDAYPRAPD